MIDKKQSDYEFALKSFLSLLTSAIPYLKIKIIVCDFEKVLINCIHKSFNESNINQNLKRDIKL